MNAQENVSSQPESFHADKRPISADSSAKPMKARDSTGADTVELVKRQ